MQDHRHRLDLIQILAERSFKAVMDRYSETYNKREPKHLEIRFGRSLPSLFHVDVLIPYLVPESIQPAAIRLYYMGAFRVFLFLAGF
jgi:hypothetical protein